MHRTHTHIHTPHTAPEFWAFTRLNQNTFNNQSSELRSCYSLSIIYKLIIPFRPLSHNICSSGNHTVSCTFTSDQAHTFPITRSHHYACPSWETRPAGQNGTFSETIRWQLLLHRLNDVHLNYLHPRSKLSLTTLWYVVFGKTWYLGKLILYFNCQSP